jgi:hypothetical protein
MPTFPKNDDMMKRFGLHTIVLSAQKLKTKETFILNVQKDAPHIQ